MSDDELPTHSFGRSPQDPARSPRGNGSVGETVGCVLTDPNLKPLYVDEHSLRILMYPNADTHIALADVQRRLRTLLGAERHPTVPSPPVSFLSGRRKYLCQYFLLRSLFIPDAPTVALVFERENRTWRADLFEASRRYNLSPRETETVQYLVRGLTTKEIAARMNVSPNTVKQFVRLVMSKTGTATRAGILGKLSVSKPD